MQDLARFAVDAARAGGAGYADARVVHDRTQDLNVRNGQLRRSSEGDSLGLGVRVIARGCWGFASTDDLSRKAVEKAARLAVRIAASGTAIKAHETRLAEERAHVADWTSPCVRDPFRIPIDKKVEYMLNVDRALRDVQGITYTNVDLVCRWTETTFANSQGSLIKQTRVRSGAGMSAGAFKDGQFQTRSYPASFRGQWALRGYELVDELDLLGHAPATAEEAVSLLSAAPCPSGEMDLILESSQLALQIHESVGHPTELDRILGHEANYAGMSFITADRLGRLVYGSPRMNIVADARLEHGPSLGCFAFDDEGVPAQKIDIVKEGLLVGLLSSRETAREIGLSSSGGCMRASGWNRIPLIRMTQMSLLPGEGDLDALIADTKDGILMATNKSWSIDDKRLNFQFGCEAGWRIKNGKRDGLVRNPTYAGVTPQFWASLDAVCGPEHWTLWGIPNCGKGQPGQSMEVAHGAAPARFRNVKVGVAG
ncbi:MAG: TldD/PmbA family protein [Planctomycetes bacterium]|nr:TldD/PmbA family protein [Planctomycetota bacterium]